MGFWVVPLIVNTRSALDPRLEFVLRVLTACAASDIDARATGAIMADAVIADPSSYGSSTNTLNRAYSFLRAWKNLQTSTRLRRAANLAATSLEILGATDTVTGFA